MKKLKVKPGDILEVPVESQEFSVFCRVISEEDINANLVEFFKYPRTEKEPGLPELDISDRLFRPVFFKFTFIHMKPWKKIGSTPNYTKEVSDYKNITIAFRSSIVPELWIGGEMVECDREKLIGHEPSIVWFPENIADRIAAHVSGKLGPLDPAGPAT